MVKKKYIPERGDVVWLNFNPTKGHEQKGTRPAVVLSRQKYNKNSELLLACPITSVSKKYPFEVILNNCDINGVVLADQIKNIDWTARNIKFIYKLEDKVLQEIIKKVSVLIQNK